MLESRRSYGYGYVGSDKEGFEYKITFNDAYAKENIKNSCMGENWCNKYINTIKSGYVYPTEKKAVSEGNKYLKRIRRTGVVLAIPADRRRFEY